MNSKSSSSASFKEHRSATSSLPIDTKVSANHDMSTVDLDQDKIDPAYRHRCFFLLAACVVCCLAVICSVGAAVGWSFPHGSLWQTSSPSSSISSSATSSDDTSAESAVDVYPASDLDTYDAASLNEDSDATINSDSNASSGVEANSGVEASSNGTANDLDSHATVTQN